MTILLLLLTLGLLAAPSRVAAQIDCDTDNHVTSSAAWYEAVAQLCTPPCQTGYLFINRTYIHPPYQIRLQPNQLTINGEPVHLESLKLQHFVDDSYQSKQSEISDHSEQETRGVHESKALPSDQQVEQGTILVTFTPLSRRRFQT